MDNSLSFPKLINFSMCWQIFTWMGIGCERWMCKSTAGGKLNLSGPAAGPCMFYSFGYLSPASVIEQYSWASVFPGWVGSHSVVCLPTAQHPTIANSKNDSPITISKNWDLSWLFFILHLGTSVSIPPAFHSTLNLGTALSGLFYNTSLLDNKTLIFESAFLCILILVMVHSDKNFLKMTCFLAL